MHPSKLRVERTIDRKGSEKGTMKYVSVVVHAIDSHEHPFFGILGSLHNPCTLVRPTHIREMSLHHLWLSWDPKPSVLDPVEDVCALELDGWALLAPPLCQGGQPRSRRSRWAWSRLWFLAPHLHVSVQHTTLLVLGPGWCSWSRPSTGTCGSKTASANPERPSKHRSGTDAK